MNAPLFESDTSITRILVVDDIADNYVLLQAILELEGYQVEVADNGYAALERVEVNPPDLILLDVMMPGINGFEITQRIRDNSYLPFIPILLVTADRAIEKSLAFYKGANGLLYKPIDLDLLLEQVRAILSQGEKGRGLETEGSPDEKISQPCMKVVFPIPDSRLPTPHLQVRREQYGGRFNLPPIASYQNL